MNIENVNRYLALVGNVLKVLYFSGLLILMYYGTLP